MSLSRSERRKLAELDHRLSGDDALHALSGLFLEASRPRGSGRPAVGVVFRLIATVLALVAAFLLGILGQPPEIAAATVLVVGAGFCLFTVLRRYARATA